MATWISEAVKHTTQPAAVVEIALDSGTRKYGVDYIRPIGDPAYKGNILKLPYISNSIGDLVRTFIYSRIEIIFADTDREFRNIIMAEGIKNRQVTVKLLFIDKTTSITALTIFIGNIYNWNPMKDMRFKIECEQKSKNLKNTYPNKVVEATDYANADEWGLGQLIPVPYGTISALGLSGDGAFPCILVDPTQDDEIHLVGLQAYIEEVTNGSFSEGDPPDNWTARAGAILSREAGGQVGNCLMVKEGGFANPYARGENVDLVAGKTYEFSFYVKKGTEETFRAYVWHDGVGYGVTGNTEATGAWVPHTVTFEATATETSTVRLVQMCDAAAGTTIYFDEAYVYEVIGVDRVYIDKGAPKTVDVDYTINYQVIDNKVHTQIYWENGVRPTFEDIVSCDITFGTRNPCEAWKHFLINFCGHEAADFHVASYDAAHVIEQNRGYTFDGAFIAEKELIAHEDQIRDEFELDIWRDPKDGLIHFKYISSLATPTVHYKDYIDILKGYEPNTQVTKIINYLTYAYNYNYARTYFNNLPYREDTDSQTKYGATYRSQQNFYFVRSTAVALDLAARKLLRRKDSITFDKFPLPIKAFNDNLGDFIEITHFEGKGASGYQQRTFQLRATQDNLDNFSRRETLEDVSNYVGGGKAFLMGPTALPLYAAATAAQKAKYGFCCDEATEQYSNGDEAKRLYD